MKLRFSIIQYFNECLSEFLPNFHFTRDNSLLSILEEEIELEEKEIAKQEKFNEIVKQALSKSNVNEGKQEEAQKVAEKTSREKREARRERAESFSHLTLSLAARIIKLKRLIFAETKEKLFNGLMDQMPNLGQATINVSICVIFILFVDVVH
jgi:putative cell wall-binding protein